ncbi:sensor histidine kinase [Longispora urticae]
MSEVRSAVGGPGGAAGPVAGVWERRYARFTTALPFAALAVASALTFLTVPFSALTAGYVGLAVLLLVWLSFLSPRTPAWTVANYAALMVVTGLLLTRYPWFGLFTYAGYFLALTLPRRLTLLGVAITATYGALSWRGGIPLGFPTSAPEDLLSFFVSVVFNIGAGAILTLNARYTDEQHETRRRNLDALAEANRQLEDALAENAGLHAQLLTQAREAGVLDERQRMARELHDTLAQGLTGIITQLEAAEQTGAPRHLHTAAQLARDSLAETRRSMHALRPSALDNTALPDALAVLAGEWSAAHGTPATFTATGAARPLHPELEATLLRTAQEALSNAARHARASRIGLTLSYMEDVVTLDVRDDGRGFEPSATRADAFGLVAMRQRVSRVGGTCEIETEVGGGTAISACVPAVPAEAPA